MATRKEENNLMEMLKLFFLKLFGPRGPKQDSESDNKIKTNTEKLVELSDSLQDEINKAKDQDDFIKQSMLERQKCCVDGMSQALSDLQNGVFDPKQEGGLESHASKITASKIEELTSSEEFKDNLADYKNHDPALVQKAAKEVNSFVVSKTRELDFGSSVNNINSLMRQENNHAIEFLKRPPESHAQEIGNKPKNEEIINEREKIVENQNEFNDEYYSNPENEIKSGYSS